MIANTSQFVPVAPRRTGTTDALQFSRSPELIRTASSGISVWRVALEGLRCGRPGGLECIVTRDEAVRANRFRRAEDRRRFLVCRRVLRALLSDRTGSAAHLLAIDTAPGGKPFLRDREDLHFNLSHTSELALVAIADGSEVGVDVERIDLAFPVMATAREFFRADEVKALAALDLPERAILFFRLWCAREAALKAVGSGFCEFDPGQIEVDLDRGIACLGTEDGSAREIRLREIEVGDRHVGMVAHLGSADLTVDLHDWRE